MFIRTHKWLVVSTNVRRRLYREWRNVLRRRHTHNGDVLEEFWLILWLFRERILRHRANGAGVSSRLPRRVRPRRDPRRLNLQFNEKENESSETCVVARKYC